MQQIQINHIFLRLEESNGWRNDKMIWWICFFSDVSQFSNFCRETSSNSLKQMTKKSLSWKWVLMDPYEEAKLLTKFIRSNLMMLWTTKSLPDGNVKRKRLSMYTTNFRKFHFHLEVEKNNRWFQPFIARMYHISPSHPISMFKCLLQCFVKPNKLFKLFLWLNGN